MLQQHTLESAIRSHKEGNLEEWIHRFLLSDGGNVELSNGLKLESRCYFGPIEIPINLVVRCCGPEPGMKYAASAEGFSQRVEKIKKVIVNSGNLPPLMINYSEGELTLNDGNHRHEALRQLGRTKIQAIVWSTGDQDMKDFKFKYGTEIQVIA